MTISVKPKFTSNVPDEPDAEAAGLVTPSRWNQGHEITMATGRMLGRVSADDGLAEELTGEQVKAAVGLSNVDNTPDADKPVSTATQAALDEKLDADNFGEFVDGLPADPAPTLADIVIPENRGGVARKVSGTALSTLIKNDLATISEATQGADYSVGIDALGAPALLSIKEVDVTRYGASGEAGEDATAAFNAAKTALRNAGGGALLAPRGTYEIDSFHWDWIAGGYGKLHIIGDGVNSVIKKRVDDAAAFFTIGRNDTTQTYQGAVFVENLAIDGINGGGETVFDLWSLTTFNIKNVRARYGAKAIRLMNCVTGTLDNCQGSDSGRGLSLGSFTFPDATFSASNLFTVLGSAFKDNAEWGVVQSGGSQLVLLGTQIEHNGEVGEVSGGLYVATSAGDLGTNRKFRAVTALGVWIENNSGYAGVALDGGASVFEGSGFVANTGADWDLVSNGGKYTLVDASMPNTKTNGNIKDDSAAPTGNIIIGGEIVGITNVDRTKTTLIDVQTGSGTTATRVTSRKGRADVQAGSTDEKFIQAGLASGANGDTVTFASPFGAVPRVVATINGNDTTKAITIKVYNVTTTGFQFEKTEVTNGGGGAVAASSSGTSFSWIAIGNTP